MDVPHKPPTTWDEYEGVHRGSVGSSTGSHVQWEDGPEQERGSPSRTDMTAGLANRLRQRRSSMSMRFNSIRHAGGVNSIDNFARSWQRAAGFHEVTPVRAYRATGPDDIAERHGDIESTPAEHRSLLREAFESEGRRPSDDAVGSLDDVLEGSTNLTPVQSRIDETRNSFREESIFSIEPALSSPFGASYGTTYGSLRDRANESSMRHAGRLFTEQQLKGAQAGPEQDREPLLVKQVEEDGHIINVVVGQSTLPQTIFNSVNVLIGVGLLTLPLALKYSGWVIGILFFVFAAITTAYTAKVLAKCLDVDSSLVTFADLAYVAFGPRARIAVSILFTVELLASCVALVVLFADSLNALIPGLGLLGWKIVCGAILIPLGFLPLRLLSFTSILGILSCLGIVCMVFIDGAIKPHQPGSWREPATTYLFPAHWGTVPLSFGLMMSPWGGHSVFPNIYRDMRHPYKYNRGVNITYSFTFLLDISMAVVGILMFGDGVLDEITSNILLTPGYPQSLSLLIVICIGIIPLTKVPLNARPIISTIELFLGLDARSLAGTQALVGTNGFNRGLLKVGIRVATTILFVLIAIVLPSFDRIMTLMGAVACFTICIILPLAFNLKLFGKELGRAETAANWVLIVVSSIMAAVSTVAACLPKELLGA